MIDFDILNNSISTLFENKKIIKNEFFNNSINKINKNLDVLCKVENIINVNDNMEIYKIQEILNMLKRDYDFIVIDTSSRIDLKYVKLILTNGDKIIFLVEPNILELKKTNNLLEVYINDFNIDVDKIKIVFNKVNKYQIAESILEEFFSEFEIIGKIEYEEKYNLFINRKLNNFVNSSGYEKIYKKILEVRIKKLMEEIYGRTCFRNKWWHRIK